MSTYLSLKRASLNDLKTIFVKLHIGSDFVTPVVYEKINKTATNLMMSSGWLKIY